MSSIYAPEAEAGVGSVLVQFFKQLSKLVPRETDARVVDDIFQQRKILIENALELNNRREPTIDADWIMSRLGEDPETRTEVERMIRAMHGEIEVDPVEAIEYRLLIDELVYELKRQDVNLRNICDFRCEAPSDLSSRLRQVEEGSWELKGPASQSDVDSLQSFMIRTCGRDNNPLQVCLSTHIESTEISFNCRGVGVSLSPATGINLKVGSSTTIAGPPPR